MENGQMDYVRLIMACAMMKISREKKRNEEMKKKKKKSWIEETRLEMVKNTLDGTLSRNAVRWCYKKSWLKKKKSRYS